MKPGKRKVKLCFVASIGGHLEEIAQLQEIMQERDSFLITEKNDFQEQSLCSKVYYVPHINRREKHFLWHFLKLWLTSFQIFMTEKPDCIITTGALICFPISVISKVFRRKVIYIESFARVHTASLTGKLMYHVADLFIVQSESLKEIYPKSVYCGCIF